MNDYFSAIIFLIIIAFFVGLIFWLFSRAKEKSRFEKSLDYVLYEILLPRREEEKDEKKTFKDYISVMEQFLVGMKGIKEGGFWNWMYGIKPYFVLELALSNIGEETVFYAAIPKDNARFFEKQFQAIFPDGQIEPKYEDYNIFNSGGQSAASRLALEKNPVLPIKTYQKLESDPLEVIATTFSKLKKQGEGAALQIVLSPDNGGFGKKIKRAIEETKKGEKLDKKSKFSVISKEIKQTFGESKSKVQKEEPKTIDEELAKLLQERAAKNIFSANIRLIASAETKEEAEGILGELEGAFFQFGEPRGNAFKFNRLSSKEIHELAFKFSFRIFEPEKAVYLTTEELSSIFHFPFGVLRSPKIKFLGSRSAPAPANIPEQGLSLGTNYYRGEKREIKIRDEDRRRHLYIVGQTGTGKSEFMKNLIAQDIFAGKGACMIDPHGDLVEDILGLIPRERIEDVVYFNPGDISRPIGLNFLEYDETRPEQKTFIADELYGIFRKIWKDIPEAFGPMFEQYYRNSVLLTMEDPDSGNTLVEVGRVLAEKSFRDLKLSRSTNPMVNNFWREVAEKAGGEASLANFVPYITSKFDVFLGNEIMRPIIAQPRSSVNFRQIMDENKILLVNLSKGRLGEINSSLLGLIIVGKILMSAFSRVDQPLEQRKDFYLYMDEFQNVTTKSIAVILSEARKYRLSLTMAHQFIGQLEEDIKKAVFGNVGSIISFRVGVEDAEFLEKQFEPVFTRRDLLSIGNFNAYLRLLIDNQTARPFNIKASLPLKGNPETAKAIKELSSLKYGRPREEVEEEIKSRFKRASL